MDPDSRSSPQHVLQRTPKTAPTLGDNTLPAHYLRVYTQAHMNRNYNIERNVHTIQGHGCPYVDMRAPSPAHHLELGLLSLSLSLSLSQKLR